MSLEDIYYVSQVVAAVSIVASLVFVGLQVRQTERNQRAIMNQGVLSRAVSLGEFVTQPHINSTWAKVIGGATEFSACEVLQLSHLMRSLLLNLQDAFVQHKAGLTDDITFENALNMAKAFMAQPVYRALWIRSRATFAPDMAILIDRIIRETSAAEPVDLAAQFRTDFAMMAR